MVVRALTLAALVAGLSATAASAEAKTHSSPASLDRRLAATLRIPGVISSTSTAVVVELPSGQVVFGHNADVSLQPASNEKLGVTFAALQDLGAGYRFPTSVLGDGRRVGSTWEGRLFLKGSGDPSLTSGGLNRLVNILWRMGIRHVTGNIVGDATVFDRNRVAPGWLASFAGNESPPLAGLVVNRAARHQRLVANPPLAAAAAFDRLLRARGIVAGSAGTGKAPSGSPTLATIYSDPLSLIIEFMDHYSDNFTAEMVLKALGAHVFGLGTSAAGAAVVRRDLGAAGIPLEGVRVADGSGLSRDDRVTGQELAAILVHMWNNPAMRTVVWNSLPIAGQNGTLEHRLPDDPNRSLLRGKTGTTDIASALSGYIGERYAFVTIENGEPVDYWAAHAAEDGVAEALIGQLSPDSATTG